MILSQSGASKLVVTIREAEMIQGVMFDVDGTLVDSVDFHARAWKDAFHRFGREVTFEEVRRQIGKGADQLLPVFFSKEELSEFGTQLEEYRAELFKQAYLPRVKAFPKVRELFRKIVGDGKRIVLASSGSKDEITHYKQLAGIEDLVAAETSADDVERSKPCPDIFAVALSRLGTKKDEAFVVGDTPYDAEAATKLGLETIGLLCGGFPKEDLLRARCFAIYRDPEELLLEYPQWSRAQPKLSHA
jgi:HAD superfamily hydrolase (TIGR01549 family)